MSDRMDVDAVEDAINIIVVGECGDGKSTLINSLRDPRKSSAAVSGRDPQGVTKEIVLYPCPDLDGKPFNVLDSPGVGDHQVPATALVSMIEGFLKAGTIPGGIRGVVVTQPVPDGRIRLGAQIVQAIVDKGFVAPDGEDKYGNIILCGTKRDKADAADEQSFLHGLDGNPSVRELFFQKSPRRTGPCVVVSNKDYSPLLEAIRRLPALAIRYEKPKSEVMAAALAEKLGMNPEELRGQMEAFREMVEAQSQQIKELMHQMHGEQQQHREEMARKDQMLQDMMMKMQEDQRRAEEARVKREADLEELRREQDADRRREREAAAEAQRTMMERMTQEAAESRRQYEEMHKQRADADRRHAEMMQQMQRDHAASMAEAVRNSGSGGGGGFCSIM